MEVFHIIISLADKNVWLWKRGILCLEDATTYSRVEICTVQDEKIRVFPNPILNGSAQLCMNELVGVGGGEIQDKQIREEMSPDLKEAKKLGFAIPLDNHRS